MTIAFFIAEMGDKTQLAAIALAAKYDSILYVWLGTTIGMIISNIIGIIIGVVLGKKIPEKIVKIVSASIFILFGYLGIWQNSSDNLRMMLMVISTLVILGYLLFLRYKGKTIKSKVK